MKTPLALKSSRRCPLDAFRTPHGSIFSILGPPEGDQKIDVFVDPLQNRPWELKNPLRAVGSRGARVQLQLVLYPQVLYQRVPSFFVCFSAEEMLFFF